MFFCLLESTSIINVSTDSLDEPLVNGTHEGRLLAEVIACKDMILAFSVSASKDEAKWMPQDYQELTEKIDNIAESIKENEVKILKEITELKKDLQYLNEKYTVEIQKLKEELVGQNRLSQLEIGSLKRKLAESKQENESLEEDIHKLTKSGPRNFRRNDTNDTDLGILKSVTGRREDRPGKKHIYDPT